MTDHHQPQVTDAMRKAFDDRNNSLEADERDSIIAAILALAHPITTSDTGGVGDEPPRYLPTYGKVPWEWLKWAVADAFGAPREWAASFIGHQEVRMNMNSLNRIVSAALSHSAAGQSVGGGEPDMFWDHDDPERCANDIDEIVADYGPGEIVKIDCAKHLPSFKVRVIVDPKDDEVLTYEYIDTAPQPQRQSAAVGEAVAAQFFNTAIQTWQEMPLQDADEAERKGVKVRRLALAAPAQPVREAVAWLNPAQLARDIVQGVSAAYYRENAEALGAYSMPVYASHAQTVEALSEREILRAIQSIGKDGHGRVALTYESGPYDIDRPTNVAERLARAVEHAVLAKLGIQKDGGGE